MNISSASFVKGIVGLDATLENNFPQVAFVGRSNAGKSSMINTLVSQKQLARTSNTPGRTQEINLYLINNACYFLDLPGYGYAKASKEARIDLQNLIRGYLFEASYTQKKVVVVIDAKVGPTKNDLEMVALLEKNGKNIVVVANKIDKVKPSELKKRLADFQEKVGNCRVIPFSSMKKIGRSELLEDIFSKN
jgi:GTP-binding protein